MIWSFSVSRVLESASVATAAGLLALLYKLNKASSMARTQHLLINIIEKGGFPKGRWG